MASGTFEHDDVADWLVGFETDGVSAIEAALTTVTDMDKDDYIEATDAVFALAAAELVAAARDEDMSRLPKSIHSTVEGHEDAINAAKLTSAARKVVQRVMKNSELKDQADEASEADEWSEDMSELLERLRG
jgi:poly-beta-hydroxyalkanoate depolymerase